MKFIALCSLTLVGAGFGQALPAGAAPLMPFHDPSVGVIRPDRRTIVPLVFGVGHVYDVFRDEYARAVDGLHFPGLHVVDDETPEACGTGVIISASGYVLTAAHVVENAKWIQVVTPTGAWLATCVGFDKVNDVAVLKIPAGRYAVIPVRSSATVASGEPVVMIGIRSRGTWGYTQRVAQGTVRGHPYDPRYWQANLPAEHGNSGGPLLDAQGRLIGLIQGAYKLDPSGEACARPMETTTVAMKTAYVLPLLPAAANGSSTGCVPGDLAAVAAAAGPAVVPIVTYGTSTPLMSPWDYSWRH